MSEATDVANLATAAERAKAAPTIITDGKGRSWLYNPFNGVKEEITSEWGLKVTRPPRIVQSPGFSDVDSFCAYVSRFKNDNTLIFATMSDGKFVARLDYHDPKAGPDFLSHSASLVLQPSEEFKRWNAIDDRDMDQVEFATFLEENMGDISQPASADIFDLAKDLSAKRTVNWSKSVRLDNGDDSLQYDEVTEAVSKGGKGSVDVPRQIQLTIPMWFNDKSINMKAWFRWRMSSGSVTFRIKLFRKEILRQATIKEIGATIVEKTSGVMVLYGASGS